MSNKKDDVVIEKNRHERRKEDAEKRRENKRLRRGNDGYLWRKDAQGEWCLTQDYDKVMKEVVEIWNDSPTTRDIK